jgi:hypothetical protein
VVRSFPPSLVCLCLRGRPINAVFNHFVTACNRFNKPTGYKIFALLWDAHLFLSRFLPSCPHFTAYFCHF